MSKKKWVTLVVFGILAWAIWMVVASTITIVTVDGDSMNPTLEDRDKIYVNSKAFILEEAEIGDIVVALYDGEKIVKRIAGVPGDTIEYIDDVFHRNGEANTDIVLPDSYDKSESVKELTHLKEDEFYLLGDNIEVSADSRDMGAFDATQLLGKVLFK